MLNKHRLPYFILGLGIGIIITNIIYSINPNIKYVEYTDEEIIASATDLGMVFIKDNIEISPKEKNEEDKSKNENETQEEIILVVEPGDCLKQVSNRLFELGIIQDKDDFYKFAKEKNVEKKIRVGTYQLFKNMDYEMIIKLLTKSL